jgi:hypothetical protein
MGEFHIHIRGGLNPMRAQMPIKEGFFLGGESDFLPIYQLNHVAMNLNRTYFLAV